MITSFTTARVKDEVGNTPLDAIGKTSQDFLKRKASAVDRISQKQRQNKMTLDCICHTRQIDGQQQTDWLTEDEAKADALQPHFQKLFCDCEVNAQEIEEYLSSFQGSVSDGEWSVDPADIDRVLMASNKSHPGPGNIPFAAFRKCRYHASRIINRIIDDLTGTNPSDIPPEFFECDFFIIPKTPDKISPSGLPAYSVGKTRPILVSPSIVRIISHCLMSVIVPKCESLIHTDQKGCVPDRVGSDNIIKVNDFVNKCRSRKQGFVLLIDFSNAFSSLSWTYIKLCLRHIGFPPG